MSNDTGSTIPPLTEITDELENLFTVLRSVINAYNEEEAGPFVSTYAVVFMVEEEDEDGETVFDVGIHSNLTSPVQQRDFVEAVVETLDTAADDPSIEADVRIVVESD